MYDTPCVHEAGTGSSRARRLELQREDGDAGARSRHAVCRMSWDKWLFDDKGALLSCFMDACESCAP
jgi:hypothetical protein